MIKVHAIRSKLHGMYVRRWHVLWHKRLAIVFHRFYNRDEDPPHNHGSWNISLILWGLGTEELYGPDGIMRSSRTVFPGRIIFRRKTDIHRLQPRTTVTTLFVHGPLKNDWGFYENGKFTHFMDFAKSGRSDKFVNRKEMTNA